MAYRVVAASVIGTGHEQQGAPCQDAWQSRSTDAGVVACVADGAGSASHSEQGARALVDGVCEYLAGHIGDLIDSPDAYEIVASAVASVREQLATEQDLAAFHATLCGVVCTERGSLVFHIGDGVILGVNPDDWSDYVVSEPENGEFAETTYFFTLPNWRSHLRVWCAPEAYRLWFLMSDGAASFAALSNPTRPTENFLLPVHRYLAAVDDEQAQTALVGTLSDSRTATITQDDKTLLWLFRD